MISNVTWTSCLGSQYKFDIITYETISDLPVKASIKKKKDKHC